MSYRFNLNETSFHGYGAIQNIVPEVKGRGFKKAFVCTDPDLVKFKVVNKVLDLLTEAGLEYTLYDNIKPNPTIENVQTGVKALKDSKADYIIAVGGGSSMDTAKAIGIIATNSEFADVRSLEGASPTKKACLPIIAVVDPDMMGTMPKGLTAATGMDALTHAIEGYITKGAWTLSDMFHLEAIRIISHNIQDACNNAKSGREAMALGQYIAGMGFSNVGLGLVHSMAHPLSALYDTPHGVACSILLPTVLAYNADATGEKYREIARAMGVKGVDEMTPEEYRSACCKAVKDLSIAVGIPADLKNIVKEKDLDFLADSALADACCPGNPKAPTKEEVIAIYKSLM